MSHIPYEMIRLDMADRYADRYFIEDRVFEGDGYIDVGHNEIVYVYYFNAKDNSFNVSLGSSTTEVAYTERSTRGFNGISHESGLVSRHHSRIEVRGGGADHHIRYARAIIHGGEAKNKGK